MPLFRDDTTPAERQYTDWVDRKEATLRRRTLDCGHRNAGEVFYHGWCDRLSCSTVCAEAEHDCEQFKGKSGIEKESVEPEAVADWLHAVLPEQQLTAEELVVLGNYYGSAPTDRVAEAFRAEVRRQGLAPCEIEIDGQPEHLEPFATGGIVTNPTLTLASGCSLPTWFDETHTFQRAHLNERVEALRQTESDAHPVRWLMGPDLTEVSAPPVDAALQPDPGEPLEPITGITASRLAYLIRRHRPVLRCPCPKCQERRTRSWWRRMFPGGTR